jgi:Flp pilus assembly protein TadG
MKTRHLAERGQVLVLIALAAVGIVAIVGLAIDGSAKFSDQRHAQNAADTAALAAALTKVNMIADAETDPTISTTPTTCDSGSMAGASDVCSELVLAGLDRAASNGYDSISNNTVRIYSPPIDGPYAGNEDYVQVVLTSTINTTFARVIGRTQLTNTVQATAFARPGYYLADGAMIISYDPHPNCSSGAGSGGGSVDISGSGIVNLSGGGIFLNSQEDCGFVIPNCADLNITGGAGINSAGSSSEDNIDQDGCSETVPESHDQEPVGIPDDIDYPPVPPECSTTPASPTFLGNDPLDLRGEWLIYPGFYVTFPPNDLVGNRQHIYMASGVYCIDPPMNQDLSWSPVDFVSLNGSTSSNPSDVSYNKYHAYNPDGVTLYVKSGGGFTINANNPTYLDATDDPDSDYQGYLIVLEGAQTSIEDCSITGGANIDINGLIFAPFCDITVNGGSSSTATINAQLIGWDLKINGNNTINFNYDPSNQVKIKRKVGLMK